MLAEGIMEDGYSRCSRKPSVGWSDTFGSLNLTKGSEGDLKTEQQLT